jgi:hypothetical protein
VTTKVRVKRNASHTKFTVRCDVCGLVGSRKDQHQAATVARMHGQALHDGTVEVLVTQ